MKEPKVKPIEIDGRTGEGGGQLVRIACSLAAVATLPIRITNVRGNREGPRGGGLKSQHVSSIEWLAQATDAEVSGLAVGSHTLEFRPRRKPSELAGRSFKIRADSAAASTLLIFQAVFPFLLFAGGNGTSPTKRDLDGEQPPYTPINLEISGGTNVSWSPSFEYLDQVLLPALESAFGGGSSSSSSWRVERRLLARGWSAGKPSRGSIALRIHPLRCGETLRPRDTGGKKKNNTSRRNGSGCHRLTLASEEHDITAIDVSMVVPADMHEPLAAALVADLGELFPEVDVDDIHFKLVEDSGADARVYVLLVARSATLRWGRDILTSMPKPSVSKGSGSRTSSKKKVSADVSRKVTKSLYDEVMEGGAVDEFLQDQLVVFQALAEGLTSFPRGGSSGGTEKLEAAMEDLAIGDKDMKQQPRLRRDKKTHKPFGEGSTHTTTARWVAAEMLPAAKWFNDGRVCGGVAMRLQRAEKDGRSK
ncbi:RNA 3'-terminal phosphate cyclase/enolpyruvate transferase [Lasiosphaeria miniovina]|uniref:RNA 3'-terminal phosphate cyclase/enolpyruvate transferase n=1 Tax=Lasiosphaeria miniovina TaxID=1954250 RepID=A0AA40BH17_9PEZI|nr:RNA 3'-terminal phosphate cyclase/enolpyruvate transferase [Lasiosphaeria miniovina]KAK0733838.1 RNA 3'-terminal phosphate cyclase/enolpyruvate transferase [Lasiosphaeria miniovina]